MTLAAMPPCRHAATPATSATSRSYYGAADDVGVGDLHTCCHGGPWEACGHHGVTVCACVGDGGQAKFGNK